MTNCYEKHMKKIMSCEGLKIRPPQEVASTDFVHPLGVQNRLGGEFSPRPSFCIVQNIKSLSLNQQKNILRLFKNLPKKFCSNISKIERQNFFSAVDNQFFQKRIENFSNFVSKFALTGERKRFQKNHL